MIEPERPSETNEERPSAQRAVLCPKCEHLNKWGTNACRRCGSRLYVSCVSCGQTNERVRSICSHCGRRLHRGLSKVLPSLPKKLKVDPVKVIAFLIGIFLTYLVIVLLSQAG